MILNEDNYENMYENFRFNIPDKFNIALEIEKNNGIAIIDNGKNISYNLLKKRSNYIAKLLIDLNAKKGDVISILLDQSPEFIASLLAIYKIGAVAMALSPIFGENAIKYRIKNSKSKIIIIDDKYINKLKDLDIIVLSESGEYNINGILNNFDPEITYKYDPAQLIYTSGTTGEPKGALLPHQWLIGNIPAWEIGYDFPEEKSRFATPSEWAWTGGIADNLLPALYYGHEIVIKEREKFDVNSFFNFIKENKINYLFLVPSAIRMIKIANLNYETEVRSILTGGEYIDTDSITYMKNKLNINVNQTYGQTEANMLLINPYKYNNFDKTGVPVPGHKVDVFNKEMRTCKEHEIGEIGIYLPDPVAMIKYINADANIKNNILLTGDLAYKDGKYFIFVSRNDDLIKISGYRINPIEIEETINKIPFVEKSAVAGLDDSIRGKVIGAMVSIKDVDNEYAINYIKNFVKEKLALYAYPRIIKIVENIPETYTGKIARHEVKKDLEEYKSSISET